MKEYRLQLNVKNNLILALGAGELPPALPSETYDAKELVIQLEGVLRTLTPREAEVLRRRFGIGDGIEHTLEEVAKAVNVTRERIRQIELKALRKLRHPPRARLLKPYLDRIT